MNQTETYLRVIPRDLFNEASLLKCLGRFWIETERYQPRTVTIEHDNGPFDVQLNEDDGSLSVANIAIVIHGKRYRHFRPINSREPWPLYLECGEDEIEVFTDDGNLSTEMLALIA